jgi:GNAT superfamily N-acetyltransferase
MGAPSLHPGRFAREAVRCLREDGPYVFAQKSAATLGARCLLLLECDLAAWSPPRVPPGPWEALVASRPEISPVDARSARAAGQVCFLALKDGQVVASTWVARDCIRSGWGRIRRPLAAHEAYVFAAHTAAAFRGQGINFALNCHLAEWLRQQGVRRAYRLVLPWNRPALAAHRKGGYDETGYYLSLGLGRFGRSRFFPSSAGTAARGGP